MSDYILVGKDCDNCKYCIYKNRNKVYCEIKDKEYYYGNRIPCELKEKIDAREDNN